MVQPLDYRRGSIDVLRVLEANIDHIYSFKLTILYKYMFLNIAEALLKSLDMFSFKSAKDRSV